jgi:RNA polymerase sigma factor (sigma-70 family)
VQLSRTGPRKGSKQFRENRGQVTRATASDSATRAAGRRGSWASGTICLRCRRTYEPAKALSQFPDTHWSLVLAAAGDGKPEATSALALLFRAYWYPLFAYLRARGYARHEAEDLLQAFFLHMFEKQTLGRADRLKGSFRGFLIGALRYFLANQRELTAAQKRGGQVRIVSIDTEEAERRMLEDAHSDPAGDAERAFDRRWARLIMERALAELESLYDERPEIFASLKGFLTASDETRYAVVAAQLDVSQSLVKTTVHRMRRQLRDILRREVAVTVSAPHEIDDEVRHLVQVLASE